jgi:hypothetical protein
MPLVVYFDEVGNPTLDASRKDRHAAQYAYPLNPYDLSLLFAMERLVSVLEGR